jgi:ketosteroid isomerase-like protein
MKRNLWILGTAVALVAAACAPPAAQKSDAIAAQDTAWQAAFDSGDASQVAAIYTDDGRLMPPNAPAVTGRDGISAAFGPMMKAGWKVELATTETMAAGELGYSVGTYQVKNGDGTVVDSGKYLETFRNVGGQWKIANDIWNSDQPIAAPGTQLVIVHRVKDNDHWLAAWQGENSRAKMFAEHGAPSVKIFDNAADANQHALLVDVSDMDAFNAWMGSDEVKQAKAEDGVIDDTLEVFSPHP